MSVQWVLVTIFALFSCGISTPEVRTSLGIVRGTTLQSRNGRDYLSFTRIPFAKPPVGNLRFMVSSKRNTIYTFYTKQYNHISVKP